MSSITVGYFDKPTNRRNPLKPPGGGMSDLFKSTITEDQNTQNGLKQSNNKTITSEEKTTSTINLSDQSNINEINKKEENQPESKICEQISNLKVEEENSNNGTVETIKNNIESTKQTKNGSVESTETTTVVNKTSKETIITSNGNNITHEHNIQVDREITSESKTNSKPINNIIPDQQDGATPQRRTRVPPGGYSSGLW